VSKHSGFEKLKKKKQTIQGLSRNSWHPEDCVIVLRGLGLSLELQPLWRITGTDPVYDRN